MNSDESQPSAVSKLAASPFSEWARFTIDGPLVGCTDWLRAKWEEMGLLERAAHPRDFFRLNAAESEAFYQAWVSAVKGCGKQLRLRILGRDRAESLCHFVPEFCREGRVVSVMIGFAPADAAMGGGGSEEDTLLAEAMRATSTPMVLVDRAGLLRWGNPAFAELVHCDLSSAAGQPLLTLLDSAAPEPDRQRLGRQLRKLQAFNEEVELRRFAGPQGRVRLEASPLGLASPDGESLYAVRCRMLDARDADFRSALEKLERTRELVRRRWGDITEIDGPLDALREALEAAKSESDAKTEFLANISHEIRTPMNAVIGFCDLLLNTELNDEQSEYVEAIYHSGQLLIQLIGQVLDYSKIASGHLELMEEEFELEQVLLEAQAIMSARARAKSLEFGSDLQGVVRDPVVGDPTRLKQIVVNLLGNSFKFTRSGYIRMSGRTFHSYKPDHLCLRVRVEDSGIGIESSRLRSLFQPFAQANSRIAREFGGSGLGLAICKRLCVAMHGDIWVESTSQSGTVFCFEVHLPQAAAGGAEKPGPQPEKVAKAEDPASREKPAGPAPGGESKLRVLVVDDNPNNLLITSKLSEHLGCQTKTVRSGVEALEALRQDDFAIVLMDVRMAPLNGIETTQRIRSGEAGEACMGIYIIALTAHALQGDRERCLAAGMNDYLSKPLTLEKLGETLGRAKQSLSLD